MTTAVEAGVAPATNGQPGPAQTGQTPAVAEPSGQFTKEQVDKAFAAGLAKASAEAAALKAQLAEAQSALSKTKPIEEQHKELETKHAEAVKKLTDTEARLSAWEKRQEDEAAQRAAKLPAALRPAWEKVASLPIDARLDVLASLEAASATHAGVVSPPGGIVGSKLAGLDIAAIATAMNNANPKLYNEALKAGVNRMELDKAMADWHSKRR